MEIRFMVSTLILFSALKIVFSHVIWDKSNENYVKNNPEVVITKQSSDTDNVSTSLHSVTFPKAVFENDILKHLSLDINGFQFTLNLIPVTQDLVDNNLTYIIRDHDKISYKKQPNLKQCHYRSTNVDVEAALSNCDGFFRGTIILNGGIYSIQPLTENVQIKSETLPETEETLSEKVETMPETLSQNVQDDPIVHAIYKRDIPEKFCGSDSRSSSKEGRILRDDPVDENDDDIDMSIVPTSRFSKKSDLTVELGIFVDSELYKRYVDNYTYSYAETKLQDFVTAVFNNIQLLYHHPTMTPKFNLKVVHYEVFKSQPDELSMARIKNGDAQTYLDSFCMYQYRLIERTWDHSFLLTGIDLIRNGNDKTISGISRLLGVCDTYNSCTLSEGFDFTSSFIGAHEIGHALGMKHDEPSCDSQYIMSNSLGPGKVTWSSCSIADLQKYLDKLDYQGKNCMRTSCCDKVSFELDGNILPGQKYDADIQCALFHGPGFRQVKPVNDYPESLCYMTWCGLSKYGRILTSHPAIEGTYCDVGKYCIQGRCTPYSNSAGQPPTIDGSWSTWNPVYCSSCACPLIANSISVLKSVRTCTNPYPSNGGRDCIGDSVRGIVCTNGSCQKPNRTVESYIKSICSNHKRVKNDLELTGGGSQLTKGDTKACKVFCDIQSESNGQKNFRFFGDFLPDGTQCGSGRYCVEGECLSLDCSGSALIKERYSCPRDSDSCPQVTSVTQSNTFWSTWSTWSSCSVTCGTGVQRRSRTCSSSNCPGSKDDVYSCNLAACPSATTVAQPAPPSSSSGQWSSWGDWSGCSVSCGKGSLARYRTCKTGSCAGLTSEVRSCEGFSCGSGVWSSWSQWSSCSKTCDSGTTTRTRSCSDRSCSGSSTDSSSCNQQLCNNNVRADDVEDGQWGSWSQNDPCSVTCGTGIQRHSRSCIRGRCQGSSTKEQQCVLSSCADWGGWSSWSDCGGARIARRRIRNCYGSGSCSGNSYEDKPCWS